MDERDILRAKKAIAQVEDDLKRRKKSRSEYRPNIEPVEQVRYIEYVPKPQKSGFSKSQTCFLMTLTAILTTICVCASPFVFMYFVGPPPDKPLFSPTVAPATNNVVLVPTSRPNNQTSDGLVFTTVRLIPFVPDNPIVQPGPGNWWRLEVTVYNNSSKPITLRGYDIILRDSQAREFWYDQGLSMFGVKNGLVEQVNPGVTIVLPTVFNLPQQLAGLTLFYDGAIVPIDQSMIVQ